MKLKKTLTLLMTLIISVSLLSCKNKPSSAVSPNIKNNEELSNKIIVWSSNSTRCKSIELAAENFKKEHPKVEFEFVNLENKQIYDKLVKAVNSNEKLPDIVSVEGEYIPKFATEFPQAFVDLTSEVSKNNFLPVKISECTVKDKIMAFPGDASPCGLFYRKDIFEKIGVKPEDIKTWDDYILAGKKLDSIGVKMLPIDLEKDDVMYRQLINQLGTFYFDKDGKPILNSDLSIKIMTLIKKMKDENIVYENGDLEKIVTAAKDSKIASVPSGIGWAEVLKKQCKDESGKWSAMRLPAFEAGGKTAASLGGSNIMVIENSKNKKASVEFAKFAATDKDTIIKSFKDLGVYPSYIPSYSEEIFEEKVEYFDGQQIWKLFAEIGKEVPKINFTANFIETKNNVIHAQSKIILNGADVKSTMDELQKKYYREVW